MDMMDRSDSTLLALISASRNAAETLSPDGRKQDRQHDSDALLSAVRPFVVAAMEDKSELSNRILEVFGLQHGDGIWI